MRGRAFLLLAGLSLGASPAALAASAPQGRTAPRNAAPPARPDPAVQGVTVTAPSAAETVQTSIDRQSYSTANDLQATSGTVADALRAIPSVQVDVQGDVNLRGDGNVVIMIDGKPSGMLRGANRGQVLQQLQASAFERVEVITNPSAAFSPEGSAGVINLITKQSRGVGTTGSVRATVGTGDRQSGGLNIADNSRKLTVSGDLGWRRDGNPVVTTEDRTAPAAPGRVTTSRQVQTIDVRNRAYNLRGGVDWDPDARTRLSAEARYNDMRFDSRSLNLFDGQDAGGAPISRYDRDAKGLVKRTISGVSGDYRRKFAGDQHEFTLHLGRERTASDGSSLGTLTTVAPAPATLVESFVNIDTLTSTQAKAEYKRPFGQSRLAAGYEMRLDANLVDNSGARGATAASVAPDPTLINVFDYRLDLHAVYATWQQSLGKFAVMPGLRLESATVKTDQRASGLRDGYDYLKLYPSLHLQYVPKEGQRLSASYSRRIQRPGSGDLNPFRYYADPYTFREGNPRLEPQVTDSFEVAFQQRKAPNFFQATAYWRISQKGVTDVVRDLGGGVFLNTKANLAESRSGGVELVVTRRLSKTLTASLNTNLGWNEIGGTAGFPKRSGFTPSGFASLNWQATAKDFVQLNGFVQGKRLTPQGYRAATGMLNLGYRHKFTDKLAGIVTVQDALKTYRDRQFVESAALSSRRVQAVDLRAVYFGLTYSFGGKGRAAPQADPGFNFQAPGAGG